MLEEIQDSCAKNQSEGEDALTSFLEKVEGKVEVMVNHRTRELNRDLRAAKKLILKQEQEIEKLRADLGKRSKAETDSSQVALARAKTFAILDSILFAIENWATDDSPAPDFTLASQATLFPIFFSEVSNGDENYYITEVPTAASEVVRRGREFVQSLRLEGISVMDETGWPVLQPLIHDWWTRDGMPLLYGASSVEWQVSEPFSREQMLRWKNLEAARALEFPLIFDGFELVKKYGDEIREDTGLPEFSRQAMQTRIKTNE